MKLEASVVADMLEGCANRIGSATTEVPMYWSFKLFHPSEESLKQLCTSLSDELGMLVSLPSRNRNPDYEVEGWVCKVGIVAPHTTTSFAKFYEPMSALVRGAGADIVEAGPDPVPKRLPKQDGWHDRWSKRIEEEKRKLAQPPPFIASPDIDGFPLESLQSGCRSPFLRMCDFNLKGNAAFLTDMRPGPTDDGISIALNPGRYRVALSRVVEDGFPTNAGFEFSSETEDVVEGEPLGEISTDLATIGVYDQHRLRSCFHHDSESIFSWGEYAMGQPFPGVAGSNYRDRGYGALIYDLKRGHILPYATSGRGDGTYPVVELLQHKKRVGFRVWFARANYALERTDGTCFDVS
ncbi:MAG: hypothetical protein KDA57_23105 [Planctomycetales bacterium]|nr:hypothetical protein [Planctomycetales bacterium]